LDGAAETRAFMLGGHVISLLGWAATILARTYRLQFRN
jgi:hypothetical protein